MNDRGMQKRRRGGCFVLGIALLFIAGSFGGALNDIKETQEVNNATNDSLYEQVTKIVDSPDDTGEDRSRTVDSIGSQRWMHRFGRIGCNDHAESVRQTTDGGYFIVGDTESDNSGDLEDVYIIKTDADGNEQWNKTFGEPGIQRDVGLFGIQTSDGGYILSGWKGSFGGTWFDLWVIKTDSNGDMLWNRVFIEPDFEWGKCIQHTTDGGYIVVGMNRDNVWLLKLDENGYKEWDKIFAGYGILWGEYVQQISDGGYILTARTNAFGNGSYDAWLIKTDGAGNLLLNQTYGGPDYDLGKCIVQTTEGQYVIAGITESFGAGEEDMWLIKTNENGEMIWNKTFGGPYVDTGESVQQTSDGGYIITGETASYGAGAYDVWLMKTDDNGTELWNRTFGGADYDFGECVQQTSDGGYIITGETQSFGNLDGDVWLIKTDENGFVSNAPEAPTIIGRTMGTVGVTYAYNVTMVDPDGDSMYYLVDWGDGAQSGWTGPFLSGTTVSLPHRWADDGEYLVKISVKDTYGVERWSTPYAVDIFTKKTFIAGCISDLNTSGVVSSFHAIMVLWLSVKPFEIKLFHFSEKIIISNEYQGFVGRIGIIGKFNALVGSESSASTGNWKGHRLNPVSPISLRFFQ